MAKMQEEILEANNKRVRTPQKSYIYSSIYYSLQSKGSPTINTPTNQPQVKKPTPITTTNPPIKKLSYVEMRARKKKGLCYNCDETFKLGHKCKQQQCYMLVVEEEEEEEFFHDSKIVLEGGEEDMEISVHALW